MMRRLPAIAFAFLLLTGSAHAQSGRRVVLLSGGAPSWVLRAGGLAANIDLNFATGQYYGCTLLSCLSIVRASNATDLVPASASGYAYSTYGSNVLAISPGFGLYIFEARTNQLLNSTAPATQTTGTLANGTYTLWVNGSGTATMSAGTATGCGTGVASQGTPVSFTTSGAAGTCIVTVGGSLNAFQLELGTAGTSFIVTAGATASRAADVPRPIGPALAIADAITATLFDDFTVGQNAQGCINCSSSGAFLRDYFNNQTTINSAMSATLSATISASLSVKAAVASNGSGRSLVANNGTVATDASTFTPQGNAAIGTSGASLWLNGVLRRASYWNTRVSDAAIKALTK